MEFTGGDSPGFPLDVWTHIYLDFTTITWKGGSTLRGTREWIRVDLEGAREIIMRLGRAFLGLAASPRDGATGSHLS